MHQMLMMKLPSIMKTWTVEQTWMHKWKMIIMVGALLKILHDYFFGPKLIFMLHLVYKHNVPFVQVYSHVHCLSAQTTVLSGC